MSPRPGIGRPRPAAGANPPGVSLCRALSKLGLCSRKQAEVLVAEGRVRVAGNVVRNGSMRVDPGRDRIEARAKLHREAAALGVASVGQAVEAPRPALGVLPLAADEPLLLERAQERIHRVRVDGDEPAGQLGHTLHELVAVGRLASEEVQDEQRQQAGPAQLGDEGVLRPGPAGAGRTARGLERRGLGDGLLGLPVGHLRATVALEPGAPAPSGADPSAPAAPPARLG